MRLTASAVAMKVLAGRTTSSSGAYPRHPQREFDRVRPVGHPDAMGDSDGIRIGLLELGNRRTTDKCCGGEDLVQAGAYLACDLLLLRPQVDQGNPHVLVLSMSRSAESRSARLRRPLRLLAERRIGPSAGGREPPPRSAAPEDHGRALSPCPTSSRDPPSGSAGPTSSSPGTPAFRRARRRRAPRPHRAWRSRRPRRHGSAPPPASPRRAGRP